MALKRDCHKLHDGNTGQDTKPIMALVPRIVLFHRFTVSSFHRFLVSSFQDSVPRFHRASQFGRIFFNLSSVGFEVLTAPPKLLHCCDFIGVSDLIRLQFHSLTLEQPARLVISGLLR